MLAVALLAAAPVQAGDPSFAELQASADPALLLEWGKRYFYGVRAPQDMDKAIELYCGAAQTGSAEAQFRLGDLYARSVGGKRDEVLAASWLVKAALAKFGAAKQKLAQWDLTKAELDPNPGCVLSGQMVARTLPRPTAPTPAAPKVEKPPPSAKIAATPGRQEIVRLVQDLAPTYQMNPELVLAVIEVESNFNPRAQSPKSAQGLMQLIPATARRFGVSDPWDPHQNLRGGMAYLRWLLDHFDGDLRLALAGYNAGEEAVRRHGGVPPYSETKNYVKRVASALGVSEDGLGTVATRSAVFTTPRGPRSRKDWESRFFKVDASG